MDSIEIPQYFICPISLQIMQDPVTAVTGITYDRSSIERWVFSDENSTCPVTNQPLPKDSDLTPNHMLRRLIQAWCTANAVDRIPTPKAPVDRISASKLLSDLSNPNSLKLVANLIGDNESNRRTIVQAGGARSVIKLIMECAKNKSFDVVELGLNLLLSLRVASEDLKRIFTDNYDLIDLLTPILRHESTTLRSVTILVLKSLTGLVSSSLLERLKVEFFEGVISIIHESISQSATKSALQVLLNSSPWGRNRTKIVEAGAVNKLIELELNGPDKRRTEQVLGILDHLCGCADGRAEIVCHAAGIAVVSKRILRVSPMADESAVSILSLLCKYSATKEVLQEMLRVGSVSKLCFVLQADCSTSVKEKARRALRLHSGAWKNSDCINIYLLTRYP